MGCQAVDQRGQGVSDASRKGPGAVELRVSKGQKEREARKGFTGRGEDCGGVCAGSGCSVSMKHSNGVRARRGK